MTYVNPARKALADAKRAMSKITMTTKCLGCSREFKKTLNWFNRQKFKCPACGSELDQQPLRDLNLGALKTIQAALQKK